MSTHAASAVDTMPDLARVAAIARGAEAIEWLARKWSVSTTRTDCWGEAASFIDEALSKHALRATAEAAAIARGLDSLSREEAAARRARVVEPVASELDRTARLAALVGQELSGAPTTAERPVF